MEDVQNGEKTRRMADDYVEWWFAIKNQDMVRINDDAWPLPLASAKEKVEAINQAKRENEGVTEREKPGAIKTGGISGARNHR